MEKRKRGRPKVDTHITDGQFNNRRQELNYKYMFEGTGVLMDAADEIPERTILYEIDDSNLRFKACKNGILEQLGRMRVQDNVSLDDCIIIANYAIDAIKVGVGVKEITVAIRKSPQRFEEVQNRCRERRSGDGFLQGGVPAKEIRR